MIPWNEHEARQAVQLERIEQFKREAEVHRLLKQVKLQHPFKFLLHRFWSWLDPRANTTKKPA